MIAYTAIILHIIIYVATQFALKKGTDVLPRAKALCLQFCFVAVLVWIITLTKGEQIPSESFVVALVGFINALAAYAQWQAYSFSLSKTNLLLPLYGVIAALLSAIFLKEIRLFQNFWFAGGVILLFASGFVLHKKNSSDSEQMNFSWLLAITVTIVIVGFVSFLLKYFANSEISQLNFLTMWYTGSFLGSIPIAILERSGKKNLVQPLAWLVPIIGIGILLSMATQYWALQLSPANFVYPIVIFGRTSGTILLGWWAFNEIRELSKTQKIGFLMGFVGLALILASNPKP